jgi:hypothetical protein
VPAYIALAVVNREVPVAGKLRVAP